MSPHRHFAVTALAIAASVGLSGVAHAAPLGVKADAKRTGWVGLTVSGTPGSEVVVREGEAELARVRLSAESASLPRAARWRCEPLVRTFTVSDGSSTAQASVRTPSCRKRLRLSVRAGRRAVAVRVADSFRVGDTTGMLCVRPPGSSRADCRVLALAPGRTRATLSYSGRRPGLWRATLRSFGQRLRASAFVVPRGGIRLLATGDSMMQVVDIHLKRRLKRVRVRSDTRVSTGISKTFLFDWVRHARRQAARRPAATVMFLGANDGFPIAGVRCCSDAWIDRYAARAEQMMRSYARGDAGRVYWLTLPVPRPRQWKGIYRAVNAAIKRAAARVPDSVRVIDTAEYFTPHGYRSTRRGVTVRQADGIHLNARGASLAAGLVARAMRRDGLLR